MTLARHLAARWRLRRAGVPAWFAGSDAVFLASYFIHLDADAGAEGRFHSRQWGVLPELLRETGKHLNWIHHFMPNPAVPDTATAVEWVRRFNAAGETQGLHAFPDSYLTPRIAWRALREWSWLCVRSRQLRGVEDAFRPRESAAWLWPLLRADWLTSLRGPIALQNCLWKVVFDRALGEMPRQQRGYYLYEGQGWERAMLHAWRKHGHGEIVGVQHATVPFWHLYYFDDPRSWDARQPCPMALPDRLAVNGAAPLRAFRDGGFPEDRLVEVEALRYLNLASASMVLQARRESTSAGGSPRALRVLVLGDMIAGTMRTFLDLIERALRIVPEHVTFTFKAHPGHAPVLSTALQRRMEHTAEPLDRILGSFDVALSANSTSAAADAYGAGLPVLVMLDGASLNLSPLRGCSGVAFVSGPEELAAALNTLAAPDTIWSVEGLFCLSPDLSRWRRLLKSA